MSTNTSWEPAASILMAKDDGRRFLNIETLVPIYQAKQCHNTKACNLKNICIFILFQVYLMTMLAVQIIQYQIVN
jgi:hypothetical protein